MKAIVKINEDGIEYPVLENGDEIRTISELKKCENVLIEKNPEFGVILALSMTNILVRYTARRCGMHTVLPIKFFYPRK